VIDERRIALLPLVGRQPFTLARLAPGVAYTGDLKFSRAVRQRRHVGHRHRRRRPAATSSPSTARPTWPTAGASRSSRRPARSPSSRSKPASFDAQQGHTAGATVNVAIKSGTNNLKGEGYWYYRDDTLSKNDFFLEAAGRPKAEMSYDRFGGFAGGPILKNRTFFFGAVEWLYDEFPEPGQFTVPTEKMRNGDFSELLSAGITIYDPATAVRRADGRIERQPFPGNVIPASRISSIARNYLQYWPAPNQAGDAQQQNNYLSSNPRSDDFYSVSLRADHRLNDRQSLFVRYTRNDRVESRGNWAGEVNGVRPIGNYLSRINDGVTGDHVWTITPRALLNVRAGWQRFQEPNVRQHEGAFDLASLGFPASTLGQFGPRSTCRGSRSAACPSSARTSAAPSSTVSTRSSRPTRGWPDATPSAAATTSACTRRIAPGPDARPASTTSATTSRVSSTTPRPVTDRPAFAAFLLGQPTGGSIERNTDRENWSQYHGLWIQDDWRSTTRLTLQRLVFATNTKAPPTRAATATSAASIRTPTWTFAAAAEAAYARTPLPELPASAFDVRGRAHLRRRRRDAASGSPTPTTGSRGSGAAYQTRREDGAARGVRLYTRRSSSPACASPVLAVDQHRADARQTASRSARRWRRLSRRGLGPARSSLGPERVRRAASRSLRLCSTASQRTERALGVTVSGSCRIIGCSRSATSARAASN
jgi:hypothetical protein